ncbi:MAG: S1 RNA-binding domain-containing protein, partial [Actinomycetota bacterium]|nr:S1 RNA-binding domain-containing protein [Actinomycetota bacterium]
IKAYKVGDIIQGKVTRIVKFGLFVQIQEDMEGLVHISELSVEPVKKPSDVAKIGDEIIVKIIDIDFDKRRMAFSIKQVTNPETASEETAKPEDLHEEINAEEKTTEEKPEAADIVIIENTPERQREKAIKEILKEMKDEANL